MIQILLSALKLRIVFFEVSLHTNFILPVLNEPHRQASISRASLHIRSRVPFKSSERNIKNRILESARGLTRSRVGKLNEGKPYRATDLAISIGYRTRDFDALLSVFPRVRLVTSADLRGPIAASGFVLHRETGKIASQKVKAANANGPSVLLSLKPNKPTIAVGT